MFFCREYSSGYCLYGSSVQLFQEAEALIDGAVNFVITGAGVPDGIGAGGVDGFGAGVAVGFGVGVFVGAGADILKVRD